MKKAWMTWPLLLALALAWGCKQKQDEPQGQPVNIVGTPAPEAPRQVRGKRPAPRKKAPARSVEKGPCGDMLSLLLDCSKDAGLQRNSAFQRRFMQNCKAETSRESGWAKAFAECTRSTDCESLEKCSQGLREKVVELGAEHVRHLLDRGEEAEAKKFCADNEKTVHDAPELHRVCHPLLEELAKEKGSEHSCPFHGSH